MELHTIYLLCFLLLSTVTEFMYPLNNSPGLIWNGRSVLYAAFVTGTHPLKVFDDRMRLRAGIYFLIVLIQGTSNFYGDCKIILSIIGLQKFVGWIPHGHHRHKSVYMTNLHSSPIEIEWQTPLHSSLTLNS